MNPTNPDHRSPQPVDRPARGHPAALSRNAAALLTGGLIVLVATAAAGRLYWNAEQPHTVDTTPAQAPSVWLASLPATGPVGFAGDSLAETPLLHAPYRLVESRTGDTAVSATNPSRPHTPPQTDPQAPQIWLASLAPTTPVRFADDGLAETPLLQVPRRALTPPLDPAHVDHPAPDAAPATRMAPAMRLAPAVPVIIASVPPVTPPHRPVREQSVRATAAQPEIAPTAAHATSDDTGLARSLVPRARPESIVYLARLATPPANAPAPNAPLASRSAATVAPVAIAVVQQAPSLATGSPDRCDASHARSIPRRPSGTAGGQSAIARLAASAGNNRDIAIAQAIIAGNIPQFMRTLVPVTFTGTDAGGRATRITLCVMPDYLALGSDNDFVRVPLGLPAANLIAERFDMVLPTTRMVDAIHAQAQVRLRPSPMTPGPQMASTDYFLRHNATLEGQRQSAGAPLGVLVSGHKKDLVLSNRLERNPGRVAIYGWHQASGQPIQPLSTVHGAGYADYSHGIRLISRTAYVQGRAVDLRDLLSDSRYAALVSSEGPIAARLMLASLR